MRLRLTLRALGDIEGIAHYIKADNPTAARRVQDELQRTFQLIAAYPHSGRAMAGGRRRLTLRRFPYLIFYRIDDVADEVVIITVRHAARHDRF